jgi:S-(hydroxymethyl)glutathione dehydrogenase/alcohol dehydrogenase
MAKAAILERPGEGLTIAEVTYAEPGPHEVLIDTKACGLCHSDLHFIDGHYPHALPCIPGHEAAGVVRAVGSEVRTVKPGDHVVSCLSAFCGHCEFCVTGRMALCLGGDTRRAKGDAPRIAFADGTPVAQMLNLSALSEQMLIHEHACVAIDKDMPFDRAAVLGCAVTTGAGTIFNACNVTPGETVLVVGCGGVGLAAINAAKIAGAGKIIAADPLPEKRALAEVLGATHTVDALDPDVAKQIIAISNGGVYGSLMSSPILNPPQSGILGMHKIQERPMVVKGQIVARPMMYLALSYDHRIVDGKGDRKSTRLNSSH